MRGLLKLLAVATVAAAFAAPAAAAGFFGGGGPGDSGPQVRPALGLCGSRRAATAGEGRTARPVPTVDLAASRRRLLEAVRAPASSHPIRVAPTSTSGRLATTPRPTSPAAATMGTTGVGARATIGSAADRSSFPTRPASTFTAKTTTTTAATRPAAGSFARPTTAPAPSSVLSTSTCVRGSRIPPAARA